MFGPATMGGIRARSGRPSPVPEPRVVSRLLRNWFRTNRRPLPWRVDRDPYRIWVAEVLLQQTRVAQAIPYYRAFVARFPDVRTLAKAPLDSVLRVWAGAGYYARARNLHAAARQLVRKWGGSIPREPQELVELPGVGPYIARAIASLAFGRAVLALEANGLRVSARLTAEVRPITDPTARARLERWLEEGLPHRDAAAYNEALMEFGEEVCAPRAPRCDVCPLSTLCRARQQYPDPSVLPRRGPRRATPTVLASVALIERAGLVLLQRRPPSGLLGGLWELPGGKRAAGETDREACRREIEEELGYRPRSLRRLGVIRHAYSHFRVELTVFRAPAPDRSVRWGPRPERRWVTRARVFDLPLPKATVRALALAGITPRGRPSPD